MVNTNENTKPENANFFDVHVHVKTLFRFKISFKLVIPSFLTTTSLST